MKYYMFFFMFLVLMVTACKTAEQKKSSLEMITRQVEQIVTNPPRDSFGWAIALATLGITTVIAVPMYLFKSSKNRDIQNTGKLLHGIEKLEQRQKG